MRTINGWLLAAFAIGSLLPATCAPSSPPASSPSRSPGADSQRWPYSFVEEPFIDPGIIESVATPLSESSDYRDQVVTTHFTGSNRYHDPEVFENDQGCPFVSWERGEYGYFGYRYIGMTESNVHVLVTSYSGGGSGHFRNLMLLTIEPDTGTDREEKEQDRLLLRKIREIPLGDRWFGEIRIDGNTMRIGPDEGWFAPKVWFARLVSLLFDRSTIQLDAQWPDALDFGASEYACAAAATGE